MIQTHSSGPLATTIPMEVERTIDHSDSYDVVTLQVDGEELDMPAGDAVVLREALATALR